MTLAVIDPIQVKARPVWNPVRIGYSLWKRTHESLARTRFHTYRLPEKRLPASGTELCKRFDASHTSVTSDQMAHLLAALRATDDLKPTCVVEIGSYRGITTRCLASHTAHPVYAVDPYDNDCGDEEARALFELHTRGFNNIFQVRKSSGQAARDWSGGPVSFLFIDAVHDYVNTRFDYRMWARNVVAGGVIAFHDVDSRTFPGTRKAAWEASRNLELFAHVDNLLMLRKTKP